jgi:hypothetical protein
MPRSANYIEWTPENDETDETDRTARENLREFDTEHPFDDPEVRQRIAELIARSVCNAKKSAR